MRQHIGKLVFGGDRNIAPRRSKRRNVDIG